ncbi:alpha-amylase family glycosyl hydrolase [Fibrella aquatica]|uniref:alpha-amylase family glycosyl hydrolase n=1 Tax=Fibrella aquatica TaxID=3242487 RepID=UPI0035202A7C
MCTKFYQQTKRLLLFTLCFASLSSAYAQLVTTLPTFPTADQDVTIIIDLKQAKDGRAAGLRGKTNDIYFWSGAGRTETGNAFEFGPTGQTNFNAPYTPGTMTSLGNDRWQIKLMPRTYYNVPANVPIRRLGMVIKNGAGTAQTEDFFTPIYEAKLTISFARPTARFLLVEPNTTVPVRANVSEKATLALRVNGVLSASATNADSLVANVSTGTNSNVIRKVVVTAQTATEATADSFLLYVKPTPTIASLPAGLRDGINYSATDPTSATLVLYAPRKSFVLVLSEKNDWTPDPASLMNRTPDGERYWLTLTGLTAGQELAFQYFVDGQVATGDPYCDKILDRNNDSFLSTTYTGLKAFPTKAQGQIVSVLQTGQTAYPWKVANFTRPDAKNMVVYEMLVRDFTASRQYKNVGDSLTYLKKLGINAIELMPVMEFAGNDSWGYNPIYYFAPDKAYGSKNDLKAFIDKCHENGIAVILDMVLNQADYEFPYVKMYWAGDRPSADSPFFNQQATHPFSVFFDFNHESPATQALVQRVNQYWLQEYKMDGFRFDLSKGFTQKSNPNNVGAWGNYDASRVAIWKRIYDQIRVYDKSAYVMLEHFADNDEEKELANYGMLFWGNHNYNYRYAARGTVNGRDDNFDWISYKLRGWNNPNVVGYLESHDEERMIFDLIQNGTTSGTYNTKDVATALERAKLAAALFIPVPGPKLIWQFGELGYDLGINRCPDGNYSNDCRTAAKPVRWEYAADPNRAKLLRVYQELIKLKLSQPAFQTTDYTFMVNQPVKRLVLNHATQPAVIIGNFDVQASTVLLDLPKTGVWYDYFTGQSVDATASTALTMQPGQWHVLTTTKLPTPEANIVPWNLVPPAPVVLATEPLFNLTVSPNPTADMATLDWESAYRGPVTVSVSNVSGRTQQTLTVQKTAQTLRQSVSLKALPAGLYFLNVQTTEGAQVRKLLKE